jgi:hypothetical protein
MNTYEVGFALAQSENDLLALGRLINHIATEHNFKFEQAFHFLEKIQGSEHLITEASKQATALQIATLKFITEKKIDISTFLPADRAVIFITAANYYLLKDDVEKSEKLMKQSVAATLGLKSDNPAHKTLAMLCNNMAATLSEKKERTDLEKKFMIELAHYSRNFWEKAGTWFHVERAEYFISRYYRLISDFKNAQTHAELCLKICTREKAEPLEMFFAHEALALAFKGMQNSEEVERQLIAMKEFFIKCSENDQAWMQESFDKVTN